MKQVFSNTNFMEKYQSMIDDAPETIHGRSTCECGKCDGFANVFDQHGNATLCENAAKFQTLQTLNKDMDHQHFEDWVNITTFAETEQIPNFYQSQAYQHCYDFFETIKEYTKYRCLVLLGDPRTTKTYSALTLLRECSLYQYRAIGIHFNDFLINTKLGFIGQKKNNYILKKIKNSNVVLLDDVSVKSDEKSLKMIQDITEDIIDLCYGQRYLIITSNLKRSEFKDVFSTRIITRMKEYADIKEIKTQLDLL